MITEAINRILELDGPKTIEIDGRTYEDGPNGLRPVKAKRPTPLTVNSLDGLIQYFESGRDAIAERAAFVHVEHRRVSVLGELDADNDRAVYLVAECDTRPPEFGRFVDTEDLIPDLMTGCARTDDAQALLDIVGNVVAKTEIEKGDDGVSATVTVKRSVASKSKATVPNFVELAPFRTFCEIEQPTSLFNVRVKSDDKGGFFARLSEVKDGRWKGTARKRIAEYLRAGLDRAEFRIPIVA